MGLKKRIQYFLLRMVTGLLLIAVLNGVFEKTGLSLFVGINPVTVTAAGVLGAPGVILLYGIVGCSLSG